MAYQSRNKPIPKYYNGKKVFDKKRDCEDFKPFFWNRMYCKLSSECKKDGYYCRYILLANSFRCTGIDNDKWQKIVS